jgi:nucleoside-diphosphate-sugar epimerase
MFRFWGDPHEFERVNVNGTRALLEAAAQSGTVRQFVQIGAASVVMGDPEPMRAVQEDLPIRTRRWAPYSSSKAKADALVREAAETSGLHTVVVRPPMIWGPGMPMMEEMRKRVKNGQFRWPGDGSQPLSTCHVDNVCHGAILAAQAGPYASGNAYFLSDGEDGTLRQVISDLLTAHGIEPPTSSSPFPLAWQLAKVLELAWNTLPLPGEPLLTRQMLRLIGMPFTLDITRARGDLGYQPIVSWQQGIQALRTS